MTVRPAGGPALLPGLRSYVLRARLGGREQGVCGLPGDEGCRCRRAASAGRCHAGCAAGRRHAVAASGMPASLPFGGMPQPFGGQRGEGGVEVDAGEPAAELERGQAGGAGAAERVEDDAAGLAAGGDAAQREVDRVGGEVRAAVGAGGDGPDVAGVAAVAGGRGMPPAGRRTAARR